MSRKKIHIDKLFREGLKNFSLFVSDRDFNAIDDKTSVFKDKDENKSPNAFDDFELEITDSDWLATKAKLDSEKSVINQNNDLADKFEEFEIEPQPEDWPITWEKYRRAKRRKVAFWWLSTGILILAIGAAILLNHNSDSSGEIVSQNTVSNSSSSDSNQDIALAESNDNKIESESVTEPDIKTEEILENNTANNSLKSDLVKSKKTTVSESQKYLNNGKPYEKPFRNNGFERSNNYDIGMKGDDGNGNSGPSPDMSFKLDEQKSLKSDIAKSDVFDPKKPIEPIVPEVTTEKDMKLAEIESKDSVKKDKDNRKNDSTKRIIKDITGFAFYIGMVNKLDYSYRTLSASNDSRYNTIRNESDKPFIQFTNGLDFGWMSAKSYFGTGIQYTSQTWNSDYRYSYRIFDSLPVYDPNGKIIGHFLSRGRDTAMNESRQVKITQVQVPIYYSRIWKLNDRWSWNAGISTVMSFNIKTQGDKMIHPENRQLYHYSRLQENERSFGIGASMNFGAMYRLNNNWMLQGGFNGGRSITSRFRSDFGVGDYPYSIGLNISLKYLFKP